jgi:alpha-L-rhamnosidase
MVHTFYLWRCSDLTARAARVLGKSNDAEEYNKLAERTRRAFQQKYYDKEKGSYGPNGGNIFALKMGVPGEQKALIIAALKSDIAANKGHLDTGIFGTQFFFEVLSDNGLHELAYEAMNQRSRPGYGWWIEQGATTTWEQWDGGGSRNHPMFGGGIVWFYRKLAGMNTDEDKPGYRHIIFKPQPAGDITNASYSNLTPYGTAAVKWSRNNGRFTMNITIPVGCVATVLVPASKAENVTENGEKTGRSKNITFLRMEDGYAVYEVTSGIYKFISF